MPDGARGAGAFRPDGLSPLRDQRIATRKDFSRVLSARRSLTGEYLRVSHARSGRKARLGLIVPKRLTGSSVQRNVVRRRLSERFRTRSCVLGEIDVVVTLVSRCADRTVARRAADELALLLKRLARQSP